MEDDLRLNQAFLDCVGTIVVVLDRCGRICRFNRAAQRISGYRFAEVVGRCPWDVLIPEEAAAEVRRQVLLQPLSRRTIDESAYRHPWLTKDGRRLSIDWYSSLLLDQQEEVEYIVRIGIDVTHQQEQQRRLRDSEARLAEAQRIAKIGSWELDLVNDVLQWSAEVYRIFGVSPDGFNPTWDSFLQRVHPDDRELLHSSYQQSLAMGTPYDLTHRICLADGLVKWVWEQGMTEFDAAGQPLRCVGTVQDITDRMQAENMLLMANRRLWNILNSLFAVVGIISLDGILVDANSIAFELAGMQPQQLLGRPVWETYWWSHSAESRQRIRGALARAAAGEVVRFEAPARVRDDGRIMVDVMFGPLRDEAGKIVEIIGFGVDVTERSRVESLLRDNERSLRMTLDALPAHIAVLDEQGVITMTNQAWKDFANRNGLDWRQVSEGLNYLQVCEAAIGPEGDQARLVASNLRQMLAGELEQFTVKYQCPTPTGRRWFLCHGRPYPDSSRDRAILIHTDITSVEESEKRLEEARNQLAHANRVSTMGEMAAGIAHELNQPLAAIRLYTDSCLAALSRGTISAEQTASQLQQISELSARCGRIIHGLRNMVKRQPRQDTALDFRQIIQAAWQMTANECQVANINRVITLPDTAVPVRGDEIQLQQVVLNLLRNAIEAHPADAASGQIEVQLQCVRDGEALLVVRDHGRGVPNEMTHRLFTPFFTTKLEGMGMGLKISRSILMGYGGRLAWNAEPSGGTSFRVYLPIAQERGDA